MSGDIFVSQKPPSADASSPVSMDPGLREELHRVRQAAAALRAQQGAARPLAEELEHEAIFGSTLAAVAEVLPVGEVAVGLAHSAKIWQGASVVERLMLVGDVALSSMDTASMSMTASAKVAPHIAHLAFNMATGFLALVVSAIQSVISIIEIAQHQEQRKAFRAGFEGLQGTERAFKLAELVSARASELEAEVARRRRLVQPGVFNRFANHFELWLARSHFGEQEADALKEAREILKAKAELSSITNPKERRARKKELDTKALKWAQEFERAMGSDQKMEVADCISHLLTFTAALITTIALFATIKFWGPVVLALTVLATIIAITRALIKYWNSSTPQGTLDTAAQLLTDFVLKTDKSKRDQLATAFGCYLPSHFSEKQKVAHISHHLTSMVNRDSATQKLFTDKVVKTILGRKEKRLFSAKKAQKQQKDIEAFFRNLIASMRTTNQEIFDRYAATLPTAEKLAVEFLKDLDTAA